MIRIMEAKRLRLAVLASGRGSNFDAIYQAAQRGDLDAEIVVLVSDNPDAPALGKARERGIEALAIKPADFASRDLYEQQIVAHLKDRKVDLVALAGYMRLVGPVFLKAFRHRLVNIHPALLPSFTGLNAQKQALEYGVRFSGCTVHIVDEGMDTGPIILQAVVPVWPQDDEDSLSQRILGEEHQIYWRALQLFAQGRVFLDGRRVVISEKGEIL